MASLDELHDEVDQFASHKKNKDNPHNDTAEKANLYEKGEVDEALGQNMEFNGMPITMFGNTETPFRYYTDEDKTLYFIAQGQYAIIQGKNFPLNDVKGIDLTDKLPDDTSEIQMYLSSKIADRDKDAIGFELRDEVVDSNYDYLWIGTVSRIPSDEQEHDGVTYPVKCQLYVTHYFGATASVDVADPIKLEMELVSDKEATHVYPS